MRIWEERPSHKLRETIENYLAVILILPFTPFILFFRWLIKKKRPPVAHVEALPQRRYSIDDIRPQPAEEESKNERFFRIQPEEEKSKNEWLVALSKKFLKEISSIDRKLQGRILEAIAAIVKSPQTLAGDTIKPLSADLKGMWRYRIGDYRLIYRPDDSSKTVHFVDFASRGSVYE